MGATQSASIYEVEESADYRMNTFQHFLSDESGATAIEYALIASAMALALVSAMPALGTIIKTKFANIGTHITSGS